MAQTWTVCGLLYGDPKDHPAYNEQVQLRLIHSWRTALPRSCELRIGINGVLTAQVEHAITQLQQDGWAACRVSRGSEHQLKYPRMRAMFQSAPLRDYVMWFDDDSYIDTQQLTNPDAGAAWLDNLRSVLTSGTAMLGQVFRMAYQGQQRAWVAQQPWFTGQPFADKEKFVTGGWWCIHGSLLTRYDWPIPQLQHRGGDFMLGVLLRQQGHPIRHYAPAVRINADLTGAHMSGVRRANSRQRPLGFFGSE